ncbi:ThiF family adenylyltransferase [Roseibium marinum]|uniref:ThiF family protein n=1 Tax=Roseibium marinum TaxID=281252 RepID=A0A2S3UP09_9HYPH|nr:ThiF family adenylyltransferase [Roseibium marinum]POF29458.1 ThiF family protein [Roseibium marinum]
MHPVDTKQFSYDEAFSRTLGWITRDEQQRLKSRTVAIAGLGGVGGANAITLARLGVSKFRLCEFDEFDLPNFNRQFGSGVSSIGRLKAEVISERIMDINPEADINLRQTPLRPDDAEAFLKGADIYVDSIDFFALNVRRALFACARAKRIPALTTAPIGMGAAWIIFTPDGMSFEEYFSFEDGETERNFLRFAVGLAPCGLHLPHLVDSSHVDFNRRKVPSTPMGIVVSAGVASTEAMKLLLGRRSMRAAPWFHQFDPMGGGKVSRRAWFGGRNPLRQVKLRVVERKLRRQACQQTNGEAVLQS